MLIKFNQLNVLQLLSNQMYLTLYPIKKIPAHVSQLIKNKEQLVERIR